MEYPITLEDRTCNCCCGLLTEEQVLLAMQDFGTSDPVDLVFCCSGYTWETGCLENDPEQPAYWRVA